MGSSLETTFSTVEEVRVLLGGKVNVGFGGNVQ